MSGLPPERAEFYQEFVAQQMTVTGVNVITPRQVASLLGMERQREMLGCNEGNSCIAEIASALGVDGVVLGEAAKLESGAFQVSLKVLWSRDGRPLTVFSGRAADEGVLVDLLSAGARLMAKDLTTGDWVRLTTTPAQHQVAPTSPLLTVGLVLFGVTAGAAALGTVGLVRANVIADELRNTTYVSRGAAQAVANDGASMQTMAIISYAVGGASLAAGLLLTILGVSSGGAGSVAPVAFFTPQGAGFGLVGALP